MAPPLERDEVAGRKVVELSILPPVLVAGAPVSFHPLRIAGRDHVDRVQLAPQAGRKLTRASASRLCPPNLVAISLAPFCHLCFERGPL